jgi:hypothetical protein
MDNVQEHNIFINVQNRYKLLDLIFCSLGRNRLIMRGKAIPVTGHGGPQGCETSGLQHFLDNLLKDDIEVVSLTCRPHLYPQEDSWY